ncbi:MAG TPA: M28 family peptidase [Thermomicrobiales bacterium]|nr:M28 family peptidase [Thermomicrobiales bacterium]
MADPARWIDEVSADEAMAHTREIAQWVRLSGSEDERKAFDYIERTLRGYGLTTTIHEPTCLVSLPVSGGLEVDGQTIEPCITHSFGVSTPASGLSGEIVYAGRGTASDLAAAGVAGKIALTDGLSTPGKAHAATLAGALAVVSISGDHIHEMIVSPVWGSPTPDRLSLLPQVVMLSIDTAAGEKLKARLAERPARARVFATVDTSWRPIPQLVADLDVDGRDYAMFSGHVDSWHYGAMDNGSANATMIETARILAGHRDELIRGVRFAFWSGHSHARYAGSTWFADRYWFDLHDHCIAHVNVDSTGAVGATVLSGANTMAEAYPLAREVIGKQSDQQLEYRRFGRAGDQSFWGVGLSSFFMSLSEQGAENEMTADQAFLFGGAKAGGGLGWFWHTTEDTIDKIDPDHLVRDIRVYVETVGRLVTEPVVPLDPRGPIDEMLATLDDIEPLWATQPGQAPDDTCDFGPLRSELQQARHAAEAVMSRVAGGLNGDAAATVSDAIVAACKALVPVNYTTAGQFDHDLALDVPALAGLRPPKPLVAMSDDELWGATHALRRELNRVRDGVRRATTSLEAGADA